MTPAQKEELTEIMRDVSPPSDHLAIATTVLQTFLLAHNFTMGRVRAGNLRRALDLISYEEGAIRSDEQREAILKSRAAEQQQRDTQTDLPHEASSTYGQKGSPE